MLSAVYAVVVCLSVCLSHSGIVSKRLNVESHKQCHTIGFSSEMFCTGFLLTSASCGPSAIAELLVTHIMDPVAGYHVYSFVN